MEGVFINKTNSSSVNLGSGDSYVNLLAKHSDVEVMHQRLLPHATVWVTPAQDKATLEFFYVLSGEITLSLADGEVTLQRGECFYVDGLTEDVHLGVQRETELLYITNRPMFDYVLGYQGDLNELLARIDAKDNYTCRHCRNVMQYSVLLMRRLAPGALVNDLVTAALFHDVGKCFTPDEILKKPAALTQEEYAKIKRHAADGAHILTGKFSPRVAAIARGHHERLDGSGYPDGLRGDALSLEIRILAAADAFDTMTTQRSYNVRKSYEAAAEELCALPEKYDAAVCGALRALVSEGKIPCEGTLCTELMESVQNH